MHGSEVRPRVRAIISVVFLMGLAVFLFAEAALAQTSLGTITGRVRDPNDAVVPEAIIKLINAETNESREAKTPEDLFRGPRSGYPDLADAIAENGLHQMFCSR